MFKGTYYFITNMGYDYFLRSSIKLFPAISIVHPKEREASERKDLEFLRFNTNDPRDKVFIGITRSDHNNALDPSGLTHLLQEFDRYYDVWMARSCL